MVRRRETRVRTVIPVRVFGMDSNGKPFTTLAHTLDITNRGARIAGLTHSLNVGEIVGLQRGTDKARFRVAWTGSEHTRNAGQAGLECVQENKNIWNVVLENGPPDTYQAPGDPAPVAQSPASTTTEIPERRRFLRHTCDIGVEMQVEGSDVPIFARCTDISRGGCYIETRSPFPVETRVYLCFRTHEAHIRALAEVRSSHPSFGMGVKFEQIGEDDERSLEDLLHEFEPGTPELPMTSFLSRLKETIQSLHRCKEEAARYPLDSAVAEALSTTIELPLAALNAACAALQQRDRATTLKDVLREQQFQLVLKVIQSLAPHQLSKLRDALAPAPETRPVSPAEAPNLLVMPGSSRTM